MNRRGFLKSVLSLPVAAKLGWEGKEIWRAPWHKPIVWKHKVYKLGYRVSKELIEGFADFKDIFGRPGT